MIFIKKFNKYWRHFNLLLSSIIKKKNGILFMIGIDSKGMLKLIYRKYEQCYCFEPNPERYNKIKKAFEKIKNVHIYNFAAASYNGYINLNISSNAGASSSVGLFKEEWQKENNITMVNTISVPCINLLNFCQNNKISVIDDYISDIQGMDLEVLKTLKPFIDSKKIKNITCEVTINSKGNIYEGLPDNSELGFQELLSDNYSLIAKGWGFLKDNKFETIPPHAWEMDCKWRIK